MLKVIVTKHYGMTIFGNTWYYIVYENGTVKKTKEFEPARVEGYDFDKNDYEELLEDDSQVLYDMDTNTPRGQELEEYAKDILRLTSEPQLKIVSVSRLYVFGERYIFKASYEHSKDDTYGKLFEYFPREKAIKEVASFKRGSIFHVELYEPE